MKNIFGIALVSIALVGISAQPSFARGGGGHGGGHHGGGHHGGGHHHASHHGGHHHHAAHPNAHHNNGHHVHPNNGHHYHHYAHNDRGGWGNGWGGGWGNGWNTGYGGYGGYGSGYGAAASWLGLGALAGTGYGYANGYYGNGSGSPNTVYTADNGQADDTTGDSTSAANSAQLADATPVTFEPARMAAEQLAANGKAEPGTDSKFMPLGVYTIAPAGQPESTALLHLAVSKEGLLRGTYHDALSNDEQTVYGTVDKQTQRVAWSVGPNATTVFETPLKNLTSNLSQVAVHFGNGQTGHWNLSRMEQPKNEKTDNS